MNLKKSKRRYTRRFRGKEEKEEMTHLFIISKKKRQIISLKRQQLREKGLLWLTVRVQSSPS